MFSVPNTVIKLLVNFYRFSGAESGHFWSPFMITGDIQMSENHEKQKDNLTV